jgi:hypothetical protein
VIISGEVRSIEYENEAYWIHLVTGPLNQIKIAINSDLVSVIEPYLYKKIRCSIEHMIDDRYILRLVIVS